MTALQPGAKVITASALTPAHWTPSELACRKPGTEGVIKVVLASPSEDSSCARCYDHGAYLVKHAAGLEAQYHGDELTPVRKRAGLEQPSDVEERLSELATEVSGLRAIFGDWQKHVVERVEQMAKDDRHRSIADAMASELAGLCGRIEELEQQRDSEQVCRRAADKLEQPNPYAGVHDDSSLIPEAPAPPPSPAGTIARLLQEELEQAHADVDLLTAQRDGAQRRNAQALETLREAFDLRPDCSLITDAADDAAAQLRQTAEAVRDLTCAPETVSLHDALEAARWKMEKYGCAASALRVALDLPETDKTGLADMTTEFVRRYRRLEAVLHKHNGWLKDIAQGLLGVRPAGVVDADPSGRRLAELAARAVLHATPVLRLLEAYSAVEIDGCRGGLVSLTAPLPPHTVVRGIADMLAEVVALAEGEKKTDRHAAGCADVRCKGCAPSTQSPR